jgi:NAD(P)-dependent dehydrogenase (short-subunit alcohol dehydrogenase family)
MHIDLTGKTALVTASTAGIGHAIALGLATAGAQALIEAVPAADILVNNAGTYGPSDFFDTDDATWQRYFDLNVMSGVRLSRHYLRSMLDKNWGRIVFISSESALNIPPDMIHYGMTKTAQLALARGLAKRAAGTGVTVNSVACRRRGRGQHRLTTDNVNFS